MSFYSTAKPTKDPIQTPVSNSCFLLLSQVLRSFSDDVVKNCPYKRNPSYLVHCIVSWNHLYSSIPICFQYIFLPFSYNLISMKPNYYFDAWAIIWHGIACWFLGFFPVLVCCDHKIVLYWYENQNNLVIMLSKSWETVRNQQMISYQLVANISKL